MATHILPAMTTEVMSHTAHKTLFFIMHYATIQRMKIFQFMKEEFLLLRGSKRPIFDAPRFYFLRRNYASAGFAGFAEFFLNSQ